MSRPPIVYEVPPGMELSPIPNIKGKAAAAEWVRTKLKIPMTERYLTTATNRRQVEFAKIMGDCYYSEAGLYRFVAGKTIKATNA